MQTISARFAAHTLLILFALIAVFHALALAGIIPTDILWGGRITSREQFITFEIISLVVNLLMLSVVLVKIGYWKIAISKKIIAIALWIMTILFALNTVGNLMAVNLWETIIFTPITLILSLLSCRLALEK